MDGGDFLTCSEILKTGNKKYLENKAIHRKNISYSHASNRFRLLNPNVTAATQ